MGCCDARDIFAARRPIRTQFSVSFPWMTPAIKAPAKLQKPKINDQDFNLSSLAYCNGRKEH